METWIDDWLLTPGALPPGSPVDQLTRRQTQILEAISRGWSNPDIAQGLGLTRNTVEAHVANVLRLLGARNRVHAVAMATRARLG